MWEEDPLPRVQQKRISTRRQISTAPAQEPVSPSCVPLSKSFVWGLLSQPMLHPQLWPLLHYHTQFLEIRWGIAVSLCRRGSHTTQSLLSRKWKTRAHFKVFDDHGEFNLEGITWRKRCIYLVLVVTWSKKKKQNLPSGLRVWLGLRVRPASVATSIVFFFFYSIFLTGYFGLNC